MTKTEIKEQFDEMATQAKKLIENKSQASQFMFAIGIAAEKFAGENPLHMLYIIKVAKEKIAELAKYATTL